MCVCVLLVTLKGSFNWFSQQKVHLNVPFEQLLSSRLAMKTHVERKLLKLLMVEVVGGFNISLLLHRPQGDKLLFDLSQSLLGFCHEESKKPSTSSW